MAPTEGRVAKPERRWILGLNVSKLVEGRGSVPMGHQ